MHEFLISPYVWFGSGAVAAALTGGLVAHLFATYVFSQYPIVEDEPKIDFDLLEAELKMDAAALEYRLANERRVQIVSGLR